MADSTPQLLAVDGNSLAHRAFHSTRDDARVGTRHVTFAVVNMLASIWHHGPYDGILLAFDHPVNRRKAWYPEYKANRGPHAPELHAALTQLHEDCVALGIATAQTPGAEADDLLAAATDACLELGWHCDVLSSDRDLLALIDTNVRLLRPRATFGDLDIHDASTFRATYGIAPHQYVDVSALRGDVSDNLKGAHGIGAKTALRMIRDYGSVTGVYAALSDLPVRIESALREARDRVERNMLLMAPIPHLRVDVDNACRQWQTDRAVTLLESWGGEDAAVRLRRALRQAGEGLPPRPPPPEMAPDDAADVSYANDSSD